MADNNFFFVFMGSKEEQLKKIEEKIDFLSTIQNTQLNNEYFEKVNELLNELYKQKEELKQSKG